MTCQHFTYGVDQHCHTMVGCNLGQTAQQGEHLKALQALGTHLAEGNEMDDEAGKERALAFHIYGLSESGDPVRKKWSSELARY